MKLEVVSGKLKCTQKRGPFRTYNALSITVLPQGLTTAAVLFSQIVFSLT